MNSNRGKAICIGTSEQFSLSATSNIILHFFCRLCNLKHLETELLKHNTIDTKCKCVYPVISSVI